MENNEEYLNEGKYQNTNRKIKKIGTILLCIGVFLVLFGIFFSMLADTKWNDEKISTTCIQVASFGAGIIGFGILAKLIGNARNIQAYMTQRKMIIFKEGIEKMAPTAGIAAKEIAKGIKEGLEEDNIIFCKHCGEQIDADSTFCKKCGKQL